MHAKASVDATTLAETETYEFVEGNVYFPPSSLADKEKVFTPSSHRTFCPWKGEAHYVRLQQLFRDSWSRFFADECWAGDAV